jgi:hypothetical protein
MPYSMMTSPTFDEETFISTIVKKCNDDFSVNPNTIFTDYYISEIGFDTEVERSITKKLRDAASSYAPIYNQSLHSYLLNKFEDAMDDCYDSDADTDSED